jgi:imidazolonepropionase-like amidohydrolase
MIVQRLNIEAAMAMASARRANKEITPEDAIRWITLNPAISLGIADRTGSLEPGKMADVVLWSADPFSVYALAEKVFIDGVLMHDQDKPMQLPESDFLLGQPALEASQ